MPVVFAPRGNPGVQDYIMQAIGQLGTGAINAMFERDSQARAMKNQQALAAQQQQQQRDDTTWAMQQASGLGTNVDPVLRQAIIGKLLGADGSAMNATYEHANPHFAPIEFNMGDRKQFGSFNPGTGEMSLEEAMMGIDPGVQYQADATTRNAGISAGASRANNADTNATSIRLQEMRGQSDREIQELRGQQAIEAALANFGKPMTPYEQSRVYDNLYGNLFPGQEPNEAALGIAQRAGIIPPTQSAPVQTSNPTGPVAAAVTQTTAPTASAPVGNPAVQNTNPATVNQSPTQGQPIDLSPAVHDSMLAKIQQRFRVSPEQAELILQQGMSRNF